MATRDNILTKEVLNLILLLDNSYSMLNGRIAQLNNAIPTLKSNLMQVAKDNDVDIKLRIISFSNTPRWQVGTVTDGVDIESVVWKDLDVEDDTYTDLAIAEANKALKSAYLGSHALRPVVILITDGNCNPYRHNEYLSSIEEMKKKLAKETGKEKVTRIAIGVEDYNNDELVEFASEGEINGQLQPLVFKVDKSTDISKVINWVTVTSLLSSITNGDDDIVRVDDPAWGEDDD